MFKVLIEKKSEKFIRALDKKRQKKIISVLETLQTNPIPFRLYDMKKLEGLDNAYRIRVGNVRITYELFMVDFLIKVKYIGFRGGAYKKK